MFLYFIIYLLSYWIKKNKENLIKKLQSIFSFIIIIMWFKVDYFNIEACSRKRSSVLSSRYSWMFWSENWAAAVKYGLLYEHIYCQMLYLFQRSGKPDVWRTNFVLFVDFSDVKTVLINKNGSIKCLIPWLLHRLCLTARRWVRCSTPGLHQGGHLLTLNVTPRAERKSFNNILTF